MNKFVDWPRLKEVLSAQLGKPYVFGAETKLFDLNPLQFDCSELIEWAYWQVGIKVPDGSFNQYEQSTPIKGVCQFGDLAFFKRPDG
jgi:cell wall-associated NlpC family hydrolase